MKQNLGLPTFKNSRTRLHSQKNRSDLFINILPRKIISLINKKKNFQVTEDGPLAPSSLSIFLVGGSFILAAVLHPQEFWCLPHGIIYYITIPAMYLLLVIYSIFNLVTRIIKLVLKLYFSSEKQSETLKNLGRGSGFRLVFQ